MTSFTKILSMLCLSGCAISRPLSGPGFDNERLSIKGDPNRKVIIAITNGYLSRAKRKPFDERSQSLYKKMDRFEGYLAGSIRLRILGKEIWTYSVWENEAALNKFVLSREHLDAIYSTDTAIEKMRSLRIEKLAKEVPILWSDVEKLIDKIEMKPYKPL